MKSKPDAYNCNENAIEFPIKKSEVANIGASENYKLKKKILGKTSETTSAININKEKNQKKCCL